MDSQLVRTANGDVLVLSGAEVATKRVAALEAAGVQVERVAEQGGRLGWLDLAAVLDLLGERKISSLLLECGSELNGAFLAEGLVDKVVLFYSQTELGEGAVPFAAGVGTPFVLEQVMGQLTRSVFGADTSVSGYLRDPWDVIESRIPS